MEKPERVSSDVVTGNSLNITFARWKDKKVVTVAFLSYGQSPMKKAQMHIKEKHCRVDIEHPKSICQYKQSIGGVHRLDKNISEYMISHRSIEW